MAAAIVHHEGADGGMELEAEERDKKSRVKALLRHGFLNVCVRDVTIQAEAALFQQIFAGNAAEAAKMMGTAQSLVGLCEFLLNPIAGALSDAHGRRLFTMIAPMYATIGNLTVSTFPFAMLPGGVPLVMVNRAINNTLLTIGGSVTTSTALSDVRSGDGLAVELAALNSVFGLGSIIGPWVGANILARSGNPTWCYKMRAAIAATHVLHNFFTVPETLPLSKRKPFSAKGLNPFGFVKLLGADVELKRLTAMTTLMSFCEMKNLIDFKILWLKNNVKLDVLAINREQMAYGATLFVSGRFMAPYVIKNFGGDTFTSIACWASAAAFALMGTFSEAWSPWGGLALHSPGINATGAMATKATAVNHAIRQGYGKGEFNGYVANMRALTVVIAPLLYGRAYAFFANNTKGGGGRVWWLLMVIAALFPEFLHKVLGRLNPTAIAAK